MMWFLGQNWYTWEQHGNRATVADPVCGYCTAEGAAARDSIGVVAYRSLATGSDMMSATAQISHKVLPPPK